MDSNGLCMEDIFFYSFIPQSVHILDLLLPELVLLLPWRVLHGHSAQIVSNHSHRAIQQT